jgi:uncharacterized membrane protein
MTQHRGIFITLMVSLALNLLIIGGLVGVAIAVKNRPLAQAGMAQNLPSIEARSFETQQFFRSLPEADQKKARRLVAQNAKQNRQLARQYHLARKEVFYLLQADDLDSEALQAALQRMRRIEAERTEKAQAVLVEILAGLKPEHRQRAVRDMVRRKARQARQHRQKHQQQRQNKSRN